MGFALDGISLKHLGGVHPDLVRVVQKCAADVPLPFTFGVSEGLRTLQQQKIDVAAGKSQTMNSRHLDGHAVDLVVLVQGKMSWAWPSYYTLADAMRTAAMDGRVPLEWGGCWDKEVADWADVAAHESAAYILRSKDRGGHGFVDGPHFQLPRSKYLSGASVPGIRTA